LRRNAPNAALKAPGAMDPAAGAFRRRLSRASGAGCMRQRMLAVASIRIARRGFRRASAVRWEKPGPRARVRHARFGACGKRRKRDSQPDACKHRGGDRRRRHNGAPQADGFKDSLDVEETGADDASSRKGQACLAAICDPGARALPAMLGAGAESRPGVADGARQGAAGCQGQGAACAGAVARPFQTPSRWPTGSIFCRT
jgi:hypothetical protein